ncbi:hypothetical protein Tco_0406646, partial [Tanacetum coccineum]
GKPLNLLRGRRRSAGTYDKTIGANADVGNGVCEVPDDDNDSGSYDEDDGYKVDDGATLHRAMASL